MPIYSAKNVNNHVEKTTQKTLKKNVQKYHFVYKKYGFNNYSQLYHSLLKFLPSFSQAFSTMINRIFNLLNISFTRFTHRSITITTKYIRDF